MASHSPAPWQAMDHVIIAAEVGTIAHMERSNPNHLADRRLIAAAPDMLQALQAVRSTRLNRPTYAAILAAVALAMGP